MHVDIRRMGLVVLAVAPLVIAACSGDDTGSTPATTSVGSSGPSSSVVATTEPTTAAPTTAAPTTSGSAAGESGGPGAHPLDGLTADELADFRAIVAGDGRAVGAVFPYVGLLMPDKQAVLDWRPGDPLPSRHVHAIARQGNEVHELDVDLSARRVTAFTTVPGAVPGFTSGEFGVAIGAALADQRFIDALALRDLAPAEARCLVFGPGAPRSEAEVGSRRGRVSCYAKGGDANFWSRPVDGLFASVDLVSGEVLEVVDTGVETVPSGLPDRSGLAAALDPVEMVTPGEPNVSVDGNEVTWAGWSLRYRADRRAGLVLADARVDLGAGAQPVLYEAYLSDLYVPYHDPDPAWAFRSFIDSAEFGMGTYLSPLTLGVDCPSHGQLLELSIPDDQAEERVVPNALCIFERATADPEWRHAGGLGNVPIGNLEVELVLRTISTVGNYDYVIDYAFARDGAIRIDTFASGIVLQGAWGSPDAASSQSRLGVDEYGAVVGPNLIATHHDHFLSFRLDLDVQGPSNHFVRARMLAEPVTEVPGRTSLWRLERETVATELGSATFDDPEAPELWIVESERANESTGNHPGYLIDPMDAVALPLVSDDDPGLQRAGWAANTIWVTPYDPGQRFASGEFVEGGPADGLTEWVAADRPIVDTDLVVWFTVGFHHVPRSEDLPIMPSHRASFALLPWNVSTSNPLVVDP
jgi:primary-amine oxidase